MKNISTLPNVDAPTGNRDLGEMRDDTIPGDGNGTPVREDWQQDMYYALRAVMDLAGLTPDDTEEGVTTSQFADAIVSLADPIGTIKSWDKSFPNTPALKSWYVECDGSAISDADSPFNGYRSRNLNGGDVVLSLSWTADGGGAYTTVGATDITALAVGDDISGSGISAGSIIIDITVTTVTISDVAAAGTISSTFTNRGRFIRGGTVSGLGENDAMQKITGVFDIGIGGNGCRLKSGSASGSFTYNNKSDINTTESKALSDSDFLDDISFDSANSTSPNTAKTNDDETRPIDTSHVWIMKIK